EAVTLVGQAIATHEIEPGSLTLGTDNGSAFTSRRFKTTLVELGVTHRRGSYRDPESQAFIESWFGKLKQRLVWRSEFETLDHARAAIAAYADSYHQRPHSGLRYRTPTDLRRTWEDGQRLLKTAARSLDRDGVPGHKSVRPTRNGRTWDRTRDLSRVKRALSR